MKVHALALLVDDRLGLIAVVIKLFVEILPKVNVALAQASHEQEGKQKDDKDEDYNEQGPFVVFQTQTLDFLENLLVC